MTDFLAAEITPQLRRGNVPRALYDAISKKGRFWLEYDSTRTRTASEAFESRQGNCMSLVLMTAALAKSLGLDEARGLRGIEISEATVIAMFLNNRAAEELAAGRLDAAYGFARRAIHADPTFLGAINTLGVLYRRLGNLEAARNHLREAVKHSGTREDQERYTSKLDRLRVNTIR